jgi:riboflavin synthase
MFTGLIESTALIERVDAVATSRRLRVATPLGALGWDVREGDSVAVNGVCLTAIETSAEGFSAEVSPETLRVTTLGGFAAGRRVNLERPLRADGRLGGHFVLGHVDAVGRISALRPDGESHWLEVTFPPDLASLLVLKGSITIDGISLTVAALDADTFGVQIVPFTFDHTALSAARAGDAVNLEADIIGKYVARLWRDAGHPGTKS